MFVIISYDVGVERVHKVHKILKRYLKWTQNSVFEGEITEGKLSQCMLEVAKKIITSIDVVYVYRVANTKNIRKEIYGQERNPEEMFL